MISDTNCEKIDFVYTIISNPIETTLFTHEEKDPSLRFNILNIRPYHSQKYANDITRDVIIKLSQKEYFQNLRFTLIGDGKQMDEIVNPLQEFDNVHIQKGFITREEIKKAHDKHGGDAYTN